jgi:hypothetical protein
MVLERSYGLYKTLHGLAFKRWRRHKSELPDKAAHTKPKNLRNCMRIVMGRLVSRPDWNFWRSKSLELKIVLHAIASLNSCPFFHTVSS